MALTSKCLFQAFNKNFTQKCLLSPQYRCLTLRPQAVQQPISESHDARNARHNRPQSPHITIYKFELPSLLSISHRFTGIALAGYVYGVGVTSLVASKPFPQLLEALNGVDPILIVSAKFLMAAPFAYHFINGIRHLVWDTGRFLTIKGVYSTGYTMLALTVLASIGLCAL